MTEPSRAISRYDGPRTTADLRDYALAIAFDTNPEGQYKRNDALPVAFRGNPGAVAFAVEYAKALDVSPITALIGIHIVDGKPTASAGLISALVRRAGHKIRTYLEGSIEEGTAVGVTEIVRADDPEFTYRSTWNLERAIRAGLMKRTPDGRVVSAKERSAWATYPENMLKARSLTECARDAAEDAILGVHYTPEELGVDVDQSGEPVYTVTQVEPEPSRPRDTPAPTPAPAEELAADSSVAASSSDGKVDPAVLADRCREEILAARTLDDLVAVWEGPIIARTSERAAALETADEHGETTTILHLFKRASDAIKAGSPLEDDVVDAVVVEDEPTRDEAVAADANLVDLDRFLAGLAQENPRAFADLEAWASTTGHDLNTHDDDEAAAILSAAASGSYLESNTWRETLDETPEDLLRRILGAQLVEERAATAGEALREELREKREEAAAATPAPGNRRPSSAERARAGAERARAAMQRDQ